MNNGVKTGFRLASGGTSDLGSTNTTIDGGFRRDDFYLDQAWAQMDLGEVTVIGGKNPNFEKTGWKLSKALFDGDITPEGFEAHYSTEAGAVNVGFHGGVYFLTGKTIPVKVLKIWLWPNHGYPTLSDTSKIDLGLGAYTVDDSGLMRQRLVG